MIVNYQLKSSSIMLKKSKQKNFWLVLLKTGFYNVQMIIGEEKIRSE